MIMNTDKQRLLAELRREIRTREHELRPKAEPVSSGSDILDRLFPGQGLKRGSLVEWIGRGEASGAGTLSLMLAHQLREKHRPAVVVDSQRQVYPLALHCLGGDPASLILVRLNGEKESLWTIEQALRSEAVSLVWAVVPHLTPVAYRRFQLAAEQSGSLGFFLRPESALKYPSWAETRLVVEPRPSLSESPRFQVRAASHRGEANQTDSVTVQIDWKNGMICGVDNTDAKTEKTPLMSLVS